MGNFVEEQKGINAQLNKKIENVESSLNKRIDGMESNLNRRIDSLQASITRMANQQQEAGRFPSQPLPNPRGVHELSYSSEPPPKMDEVKAVITLRSGKEVDQPMPKTVEETRKGEELEPEHIFLKEDSMKHCMPPPFPQALRSKNKGIPAGRHPRSPKAGESQHTPFGHHQTSPYLCKVFERSLYNQKGVGH